MWDRKELKRQGEKQFRANYWNCVLVTLIYSLVSGCLEVVCEMLPSTQAATNYVADGWELVERVASISLTASLLSLIVSIFLFSPLQVGCYRFFLVNAVSYEPQNKTKFGIIGYAFKHDYWKSVLTMFLTTVFTFLWGLLLVIPGIIKSYSYRMVPFLITEYPELSATEIITLSRKITKGYKWNLFALDLSFLGWMLLTLLTGGILGIFYVVPYRYQTEAQAYHFLKEMYKRNCEPVV